MMSHRSGETGRTPLDRGTLAVSVGSGQIKTGAPPAASGCWHNQLPRIEEVSATPPATLGPCSSPVRRSEQTAKNAVAEGKRPRVESTLTGLPAGRRRIGRAPPAAVGGPAHRGATAVEPGCEQHRRTHPACAVAAAVEQQSEQRLDSPPGARRSSRRWVRTDADHRRPGPRISPQRTGDETALPPARRRYDPDRRPEPQKAVADLALHRRAGPRAGFEIVRRLATSPTRFSRPRAPPWSRVPRPRRRRCGSDPWYNLAVAHHRRCAPRSTAAADHLDVADPALPPLAESSCPPATAWRLILPTWTLPGSWAREPRRARDRLPLPR